MRILLPLWKEIPQARRECESKFRGFIEDSFSRKRNVDASKKSLLRREQKRHNAPSVKCYWEIIADNLRRAGWSWGYVSALNSNGRTIWIADAHREQFLGLSEVHESRLTSSIVQS
jgi:hypothetical protein